MPADTTVLFFELIQCATGKRTALSTTPNEEQWAELFDTAWRQALLGTTFAGIEKIPQQQRPGKRTLLEWHSACEQIKAANADLNKKTAAVAKKFKADGFNCCILKGQGCAQYHPNPLLRTPGDIDIWLDGGCDTVLRYVRRYFPKCKPTYHHVDFPIKKGVEIEVHYRPTWLYNPFGNRKLQRFFAHHAALQFANTNKAGNTLLPVPTTEFNLIYLLVHIYRHLFYEGIGLKQLLDYYYILAGDISTAERERYIATVKLLGLEKFACALMHVMQQVFALDQEHTPFAPDRKEGEFILQEIMLAGNLGKHDLRYTPTAGYSTRRIIQTLKRSCTFVRHYPREVIWAPLFKAWHYLWRKLH